MAERRMFSKQIIDSDAFLDMSASAQSLYFHLAMRADDDGFVNNPKKILRMIGAADDDLKILIAKRFVIIFESGVIVIKHWRMHNYIRADRYKETAYIDEKRQLSIKENGSYTLNGNHLATTCLPDGNHLATACLPDGNHLETQVRLGKDSVVKDSKSTGTAVPKQPKRFKPPSVDEVRAYCRERKNRVDAEKFIDHYTSNGWKVGKNSMKDWKASVRTWEKNDLVGKTGKRVSFQAYDQTDQRQDTTYDRVGPDLLAEARALTAGGEQ